MKTKKQLFGKKEFSFFMIAFLLVVLNWPFLSIFEQGGTRVIFYYLFILWGFSVFILFLMAGVWVDYQEDHDSSINKDINHR